jgi:small-conductance mechanosensitive channel
MTRIRIFLSVLLLAALVAGSPCRAQQVPAPTEKSAGPMASVRVVVGRPVPVLLYLDTVFVVRVGLPTVPTDQRAGTIAQRLREFAADLTQPLSALRAVETDGSTEINAGDRFLLMVTDADAREAGVERRVLAAATVARIRVAAQRYRNAYASEHIVRGVIVSLVTTLAFIVLLYLLMIGMRRLEQRIIASASAINFAGHQFVRQDRIARTLRGALRAVRLLLVLVLMYAYLEFVLISLPWTQPLAGEILSVVLHPLRALWEAFLAQLPDLLFLLVIVLLTRYFLRFLHFLFGEVEAGSAHIPGFYADWARPTYKIVRFLVIAFAVVVAFPYVPGSNSEAFKGVSIFLGVLFSLGSSSAVSNIVAGVILTYMRAFVNGDIVSIGETTGQVVGGNMLVTRVRTFKNEDVTIPNSTILTAQVTNYSMQGRSGQLILHTTVTIGYDAPWRQVHEMMRRAAARTAGVRSDPPPFVLQTALDDFYVRYELNAYTDSPQDLPRLYSDLHKHVQDEFNSHGVQIMSPNYLADKELPTVVPKENWYAVPARPPDHAGADD